MYTQIRVKKGGRIWNKDIESLGSQQDGYYNQLKLWY